NIQAQVPSPGFALLPAVAVAILIDTRGAYRLQRDPATGFNLFLEPVQTVMVDGVFQAGVLALHTTAVIALQRDHRLGDADQLFGRHKAYDASQPRIGGSVAMRRAHASADRHVKALQHTVFYDGNQSKVLCEYVDIIGGRYGHADLELARQIGVAVNGFDFRVVADFFAIQPDFMIGARAGNEMIG